jgi:HlyD family secretion protein
MARANGVAVPARIRRRWIGRGIPLVVVLALITWAGARRLRPVPVRTHVVDAGDVAVTVFGRGTLESRSEAQLGFDLIGRVNEVLVDEGDRITLGQELARLEPDQVEADLGAAVTSVAASRAALLRLAAEETRARAALEFAEVEAGRSRALVDQGVSPPAEQDAARDRARLARADLDRVLAQRQEATRGIEVAAGGVRQRKATVVRATLLAPFDGLVTRRLRNPGDTVTVGTTVLRVVDTSRLVVAVSVDETALSMLEAGQSAEIVFPGDERRYTGASERIGLEVDRQTHELIVDVVPAGGPQRIAIGRRADVWIEVARAREVVRIPTAFLRRDADGPFCYVARAGRISRARVTLGGVGRDWIEVTSGLAAGDMVLGTPRAGDSLPVGRRFEAHR